MVVLDASSVEKAYGVTCALAGVDLRIEPGELVGLVGPNGAGKSSLIKIACGLVHADRGSVMVCGKPPTSIEARSRLGYLAELFRFPSWLSADEVLTVHQRLAGSTGAEAERRRLLGLVGLERERDRRVGTMSKGMQQLLGIAQALIGQPELVLLDEPTSGLDPVACRAVRDLLDDLRGRGAAVLMNSHLLTEVELTCDRVVMLLDGLVVREWTATELSAARGVKVTTTRGVRSYPGAEQGEVPAIVRALVLGGEEVLEVSIDRPSIDELYIEATLAARRRREG